MQNFIDKLIICNPYQEPNFHWKYDRETQGFSKESFRRESGIIQASNNGKFKRETREEAFL